MLDEAAWSRGGYQPLGCTKCYLMQTAFAMPSKKCMLCQKACWYRSACRPLEANATGTAIGPDPLAHPRATRGSKTLVPLLGT